MLPLGVMYENQHQNAHVSIASPTFQQQKMEKLKNLLPISSLLETDSTAQLWLVLLL